MSPADILELQAASEALHSGEQKVQVGLAARLMWRLLHVCATAALCAATCHQPLLMGLQWARTQCGQF